MAQRRRAAEPKRYSDEAEAAAPMRRAEAPTVEAVAAVASETAPLTPGAAADLQRVAGNQATRSIIQAQLTAGPAGDRYEREADRVASDVMRNLQRQPLAQRQEDEEELPQDKPLARRQDSGRVVGMEGGALDAASDEAISQAKGDGKALDAGLRQSMERSLGVDFSAVRVHDDARAHDLNESIQARAFTTGSDIFFRKGDYNPGDSAGQELVTREPTHVVEQGAAIRRENDGKPATRSSERTVRRHPSHDEEEDVRRVVASRSQSGMVQRVPNWLKRRSTRERELTQKYGIRIGPEQGGGGKHFSHKMMDKIEKVLDGLPLSHIRGTYMTHIAEGEGMGEGSEASSYTEDTEETGHMEIKRPFKMPYWLYTMLNQGKLWQRKLMDKGAVDGIKYWSKELDEELGLATKKRSVFAGVDDLMAQGNLVEGTLRHEMGHAVDHKIGWANAVAGDPKFGGWKVYATAPDKAEFAGAFLGPQGLDRGARLHNEEFGQDNSLAELWDFEMIGTRLDESWLPSARQEDEDFAAKWAQAVKAGKIARAQPWMFSDGGANAFDDDRIYQWDYHGNRVSYLAAARANALSNYQFSAPGEWFAEAYAAFYDPDPESPARERLTDDVRKWFADNLGERPGVGPERKQGSLEYATETGPDKESIDGLRKLADLVVAMAEDQQET